MIHNKQFIPNTPAWAQQLQKLRANPAIEVVPVRDRGKTTGHLVSHVPVSIISSNGSNAKA